MDPARLLGAILGVVHSPKILGFLGFLGFLDFLDFFGFFGGVFLGDHATTLEKFVSFLKLRGRAGRGRNPRGPTFPEGSTHIYNSRVGRLLVAALQEPVVEIEVFIILEL